MDTMVLPSSQSYPVLPSPIPHPIPSIPYQMIAHKVKDMVIYKKTETGGLMNEWYPVLKESSRL